MTTKKKILKPPIKIGDYDIIERIATGGMGETFLAYDPATFRKIVIKRARPDLMQHQIIKERFSKEAKITSSLFHPSIIPVYAIHSEGDQLYYTMPFVEGKTLKQILRDSITEEKNGGSTWTMASLLRIFQNVCHAISYCHINGYLHRDLKPENILVGNYGQVYVVDWGLSTSVDDQEETAIPSILNFSINKNLTRPGKVFGTLPYLPPERIKGQKASACSDIYSLGVILYQLLTLRMPFHRRTMQEYKLSKKYERPLDLLEAAPFRNISFELNEIVKKCLDNNPNKRFSSVKALLDALEAYEDGTPSWIFRNTLEITEKNDWELQENILSSNLSSFGFGHKSLSWKYLMIAKEKVTSNQKISCSIALKAKSSGVNLCFNIPEKEDRRDLEEGYSVHIGSKDHPGVSLSRSKVVLYEKTNCFLEDEKQTLVSVEKRDQTITLFIEGVKIFSYEDFLPILGSQIGFSCEDMDFSIQKIDIYVSSLKKTAGCLAVPNNLFASKHFKEAIDEYSTIALSFQGQKEAQEALFRSGVATIYLGKEKRWHLTRNVFYEKAFAIFEKLQTISTAPLSLLGKSLIYREKNDLIEEVKCLELALRRYRNHPLIYLIKNQLHTRLHECAFAVNQRTGVYLFSLLVLSHFPSLLDFKDTHNLILGLPLSHPSLYFLSIPLSKKSLSHLYKEMILSLCFHLNHPQRLREFFLDTEYSAFKDQIIFSLMYLGKKEHNFQSPGKLLKDLPVKPFIKHLWPLFLKIEQGIIKKDPNTLFIIKELKQRDFKEEVNELLEIYHVELALVTNDITYLAQFFKKDQKSQSSCPLFFLYGCYLALTGEELNAHTHFSKCSKAPYPPLSSLAPLFIEGKISLNKDFFSTYFPFEKITLYKNLFIYYTCLGKVAKADYYINKTLSESPWKT